MRDVKEPTPRSRRAVHVVPGSRSGGLSLILFRGQLCELLVIKIVKYTAAIRPIKKEVWQSVVLEVVMSL